MKIGALRHSVTIQTPSLTADGDGGQSTTWATLATVFAAIEPVSQVERQSNQTVLSLSTHVIRVRYLAGVTTKSRVVFGARIFGIDGVENVAERSAELRLSCTEKAS